MLPSHEPPLSRPSATLSPPCGERAGRGVPIWFMVPMHAQKRMKLSNEPPPHPFPLPIRWGEGGRRSGEGWFAVPMRGRKTVETLHEPGGRSNIEHRTSNIEWQARILDHFGVQSSMFDVRCLSLGS